MPDWVWPAILQGIVTAVAGVGVGWALLDLNRRTQRKDAASVIQQRLDPLWLKVILNRDMLRHWAIETDPQLFSAELFEWVPEANNFVTLLQEQQFALFDHKTRYELFMAREVAARQIELAKRVISFNHDTNKVEETKLQTGPQQSANFIDYLADGLDGFSEELSELSIHLKRKFGATSDTAEEAEKGEN